VVSQHAARVIVRNIGAFPADEKRLASWLKALDGDDDQEPQQTFVTRLLEAGIIEALPPAAHSVWSEPQLLRILVSFCDVSSEFVTAMAGDSSAAYAPASTLRRSREPQVLQYALTLSNYLMPSLTDLQQDELVRAVVALDWSEDQKYPTSLATRALESAYRTQSVTLEPLGLETSNFATLLSSSFANDDARPSALKVSLTLLDAAGPSAEQAARVAVRASTARAPPSSRSSTR